MYAKVRVRVGAREGFRVRARVRDGEGLGYLAFCLLAVRPGFQERVQQRYNKSVIRSITKV